MKERNGFVSNSSSSSFIIKKEKLTESQINEIKNHFNIVIENKYYSIYKEYLHESDEWEIEETETEIKGHTAMDNFDMRSFFDIIGVKGVEFGEWYDW